MRESPRAQSPRRLHNIVTLTPTVISSAARFVRERTDLAESRNLLFCRVQQQVPRLRSAIRDADDGTPLGMTDRVGVSQYSANLRGQRCPRAPTFTLARINVLNETGLGVGGSPFPQTGGGTLGQELRGASGVIGRNGRGCSLGTTGEGWGKFPNSFPLRGNPRGRARIFCRQAVRS